MPVNQIIPIYIVAGFLDSGKTTFIESILRDPNFSEGEKTLMIVCEDGETEFDYGLLMESNCIVKAIEDQEDFNRMFLEECSRKYKPERVIVEWNGMWKLTDLAPDTFPKGWMVYQTVTTVDARTFDNYFQNMGGDFYAASAQDLQAHTARGAQRCRHASGESSTAAHVLPAAVFDPCRIVGVAGARAIQKLFIICRDGVPVLDYDPYCSAVSCSVCDAGRYHRNIRFTASRCVFAVPRGAAAHEGLKRGIVDALSGWYAAELRADLFFMRAPENTDFQTVFPAIRHLPHLQAL